jgi:hypothetical protein
MAASKTPVQDRPANQEDNVTAQTAGDPAVATTPTPAKPEPHSPLTPYQATKRVNDALKEAGLDKTVKSPMLYIYAGKGKFTIHDATKVTKAGKEQTVHEVDEESFLAWMAEYVKGAVERATGTKSEADGEPAEADENTAAEDGVEALAAEAE